MPVYASALALLLLGALGISGAHADTIRCGSSLVTESSTAAEITARCGAPTTRRVRREDVRAPTASPGVTRVVGTTTTEEWIYDRGSNALPFVVTVVDGKVRSLRVNRP